MFTLYIALFFCAVGLIFWLYGSSRPRRNRRFKMLVEYQRLARENAKFARPTGNYVYDCHLGRYVQREELNPQRGAS